MRAPYGLRPGAFSRDSDVGVCRHALQGVDRRLLHTFKPTSGDSFKTRTDPGHVFEAYGFVRGGGKAASERWQDGVLLGRYVVGEGESGTFEVAVGAELPHPSDAKDEL